MKRTNLVLWGLLILLVFCSTTVFAQTVDTRGRLTNSIYMYEDSRDSTTHTRIYQTMRFQARIKDHHNLRLNFMGRALTDTEENPEDERRFNAYRLSIAADGLFNNMVDVEIGRQPLHPGLAFGSLDGINLYLRPNPNIRWQIYGGVETHLYNSFEIYEADDATVYGTVVSYLGFHKTNIQAIYFRKTRESEAQWEIAGANLSKRVKCLSFILQTHYDLVNSRLHRLYFSTRFAPNKKFNFAVKFKQQYPQIYNESYFNRDDLAIKFGDFHEYRQFGANLGYALTDQYRVGTNYRMIKLEEDDGHILTVSVGDLNGSVGFVYETGDLGDQTSVMFDYGYEIMPQLIASVYVDYTRYRLEDLEEIDNIEGYDYEDLMASAIRLAYKFSSHFRAEAEYQWADNPFKDSDHRLLSHIHFIW